MALTVALSAVGTKTPPVNEPPVVAEEIVTFRGSSNQSPEFPFSAEALTSPIACKLFLEEVSTKPPFPPSVPPRANSSP